MSFQERIEQRQKDITNNQELVIKKIRELNNLRLKRLAELTPILENSNEFQAIMSVLTNQEVKEAVEAIQNTFEDGKKVKFSTPEIFLGYEIDEEKPHVLLSVKEQVLSSPDHEVLESALSNGGRYIVFNEINEHSNEWQPHVRFELSAKHKERKLMISVKFNDSKTEWTGEDAIDNALDAIADKVIAK